MSANFIEKTDYSFLFNNMNSAQNNSYNLFANVNLSDYNTIKNGTYGKLLKAYYAKDTEKSSGTSKKSSVDTSEVKQLTAIETNAASLQDSAKKLINRGSDSLFNEKTFETKNTDGTVTKETKVDTDTLYKAVSDFASDYNKFIKAAQDSSVSKIERETSRLTSLVDSYKTSLSKVGITINADDTLSIDEKTFKKADVSSVKTLFNGNASFAYSVSTKISLIGISAASQAKSMRGYNNTGSYSTAYSSGNLLNNLI